MIQETFSVAVARESYEPILTVLGWNGKRGGGGGGSVSLAIYSVLD